MESSLEENRFEINTSEDQRKSPFKEREKGFSKSLPKTSFLSIRDIIGYGGTFENRTSPQIQEDEYTVLTDAVDHPSAPELSESPNNLSKSTSKSIHKEEVPLIFNSLMSQPVMTHITSGVSPFDNFRRNYFLPCTAGLGNSNWMYQTLYQRQLLLEGRTKKQLFTRRKVSFLKSVILFCKVANFAFVFSSCLRFFNWILYQIEVIFLSFRFDSEFIF